MLIQLENFKWTLRNYDVDTLQRKDTTFIFSKIKWMKKKFIRVEYQRIYSQEKGRYLKINLNNLLPQKQI